MKLDCGCSLCDNHKQLLELMSEEMDRSIKKIREITWMLNGYQNRELRN